MAIVRRAGREPSMRAWIPAADVYLTDDRSLFRVIGEQRVEGRSVIELEDCASLVTLLVTELELASLRPVHASSAG